MEYGNHRRIEKNSEPLTEEELKEISYSKEELIKYAIDMFNKECDKIDAMYDEELDSQ